MLPTSPLVSAQWLSQHKNDSKLLILDCSMAKTVSGDMAPAEGHIPGALRFDFIEKFCDKNAQSDHMLADEKTFSEHAQALGLNHDSLVVVYDNRGVYSSPRAWWMLKCMGLERVYILDGGLSQWQAAGFEISQQLITPLHRGNFNAQRRPNWLATAADIVEHLNDTDTQIIDARAEARFYGKVKEPREGLRRGHIPSSINIPFERVLDQDHYADLETLNALFREKKLSQQQRLIFSCGSGITACIVMVAAYLVGFSNLSVYDGSWAEWGANDQYPVT